MQEGLSGKTPESTPGFEAFTPNRLDWLAFMLNSFFRSDNLDGDRFKFFYLPMNDGTSIQIVVLHHDDVDQEYMIEKIYLAKSLVYHFARGYGWEEWIEIEIDISSVDTE